MSFSVILKKNSSPLNKVDKDLTDIVTVTGTLRDNCSIIDPVIEIQTATPANVISSANYAYIEVFSRYYFITGVEATDNGLWVISMHVDVLKTYATNIRQQDAIVARQENEFNMYLDDGWFMAYQNPEIVTRTFSVDGPFETQEFVLVVAGS